MVNHGRKNKVMDRKEFIKTSCNFCLAGAAMLLVPGLAGCGASYNSLKASVANNQIQIPLSGFATNNLQFISAKNLEYDIAVYKQQDGSFLALQMKCTHHDNGLTPDQNGYSCNLHGSQFSKTGEVVKGPAATALKKYKTNINNNQLIISL